MAKRIQLRRDTAANWISVNPTLAQGEIGIETNTRKFKFGDGVTAWNSLDYVVTAAAFSGGFNVRADFAITDPSDPINPGDFPASPLGSGASGAIKRFDLFPVTGAGYLQFAEGVEFVPVNSFLLSLNDGGTLWRLL